MDAVDLVRNAVLAQTNKQKLKVIVWGKLLEAKKLFELSLKGLLQCH